MTPPSVLLSADLSSVMLITDSSSETWSAPSLPESPDALVLRSRIDEASKWASSQPAVKRRIGTVVLDISDATCRWVQSPSAAAPVVAATLRTQTEEWSSRLPLGGVEPIIDELPNERSFEFVRSRVESRSAGKRPDALAKDPTNTGSTESGARMAVLIMPDALVRLWLDRMDRSGVNIDSVLSLWHALALSWGDEKASGVRAVVMVEGEGRIVWAWADGARLIVGGSLQLERPETDEASPPHKHRAEAAAQRISLDWVTWSAQLGVAPDEVLVIAEARDPLAEQLVGSLSDRWDGIPARQIRSDHPLRETVARAAASIRSVARADRGPRLWMSRLSTRPTRATRRRFLAGSLALVLLAVAVVGLGYRLAREGASRYEQGSEIRNETFAKVRDAVPGFVETQNISIQLRQRIAELESAPTFVDPPPPRPIYEDMQLFLDILQDEFPNAEIRRIKYSQGGTNANEIEIELESPSERTALVARLPSLPTRTAWELRRNSRSTSTTIADLVGTWREAESP